MVNKITSAKTPLEQVGVINGIIDEIQPATSSSTGVVQPDNVSIVVEDGVISSLAGTPPDQTFDGTSLKAQSGVAITGLLGLLYPVGSIYIGTQSTCPMATLISGSTWELVAQDRALWGGDGTNANTTIAPGVPDISGSVATAISRDSPQGAFVQGQQAGTNVAGTTTFSGLQHDYLLFQASNSSSIYGASNTVQPPAYRVNIWRRTA